jgi:hypothetical protein
MPALPILSVNGAQAEVAAALAWLSSWGAPPLQAALLDVSIPEPRRRFGADGGMASGRFNSQALVREAIAALDAEGRRVVEASPEQIVLVTPAGFHPHVWQPRNGGVTLGRGRWVRRYAVLPHGSPLGHTAHELGHLLHGWPDLDKVRGLGADCLMARGADRPDGPAAPCAALRVASGWVQAVPITAETPVEAVTGVWRWEAGNIRIVGERVGGVVRAAQVDARGLPVRAAAVPALAGRTILGSIAASILPPTSNGCAAGGLAGT